MNKSTAGQNSQLLPSLKNLQKKISTPQKWGLGERLVPDMLSEDSTSQKILNLNIQNYQIAARYVQGKQVLDIACGSGYGSQILSSAGADLVVGVDICSDTIQYAQERYSDSRIEFICSDADQFKWSNLFDVIVSFETIEHLQKPKEFLQKIHSLLVPDGTFLISLPLGETRHIDPYHLHAFTQNQIVDMLKENNFDVELYRCDEIVINRHDLNLWKNLYPDAPQPSIRELIFTNRGRKFLQYFIFKGNFCIPQLLILSRKRLN